MQAVVSVQMPPHLAHVESRVTPCSFLFSRERRSQREGYITLTQAEKKITTNSQTTFSNAVSYNFPKEHLVSLSLCNVHESQPLAQINSWESGIHQLKRKFDPHLIYNCSDIMYQLMVEEYVNLWHAYIGRIVDTVDGTGNKLSNYSTFKHSFDLEKYVLQMSLDDRRNFTKLRISCHDLAIETGRYSNNRKPLSERICNLCNLNQIEDEFHFFMIDWFWLIIFIKSFLTQPWTTLHTIKYTFSTQIK